MTSPTSLFKFDLNLNKEYIPLINDLIRMAVIQVMSQVLFTVTSPAKNPFFSGDFFQTLVYILLGIVVYWVIVRKIFIIN